MSHELTSDKQRITSKDNFLTAVFHEVADAVLSMTRRVQRCHLNAITDLESLLVRGCFADFGAVLAADYRDLICFELLAECRVS